LIADDDDDDDDDDDFLLAINTNLPPILHRFQVMADYW